MRSQLNRAIRPKRRDDAFRPIVTISSDRVTRVVSQKTLHAALRQLAAAWTPPGRADLLAFAYDNLRGI